MSYEKYARAENELSAYEQFPHAFSKTEQRIGKLMNKASHPNLVETIGLSKVQDLVSEIMSLVIDVMQSNQTIGTDTPNGTYFPLDHDPYWDEILTKLEAKAI